MALLVTCLPGNCLAINKALLVGVDRASPSNLERNAILMQWRLYQDYSITILNGPEATRDNVRNAIQNRGADIESYVVFFSCHCYRNEKKIQLWNGSYNQSELESDLKKNPIPSNTLVIMDCCSAEVMNVNVANTAFIGTATANYKTATALRYVKWLGNVTVSVWWLAAGLTDLITVQDLFDYFQGNLRCGKNQVYYNRKIPGHVIKYGSALDTVFSGCCEILSTCENLSESECFEAGGIFDITGECSYGTCLPKCDSDGEQPSNYISSAIWIPTTSFNGKVALGIILALTAMICLRYCRAHGV